jgi:acetylornithine deacetylase/succinyl-diaminopimelate desuccinylase-like protein
MPATAYSQIGTIASMRRVHEAFQWLHLHEQQIMRWQVELVSIPAPPFAEGARAKWLLGRFRDLGLANAHLDEAGNVLATLPGRSALPAGSVVSLKNSRLKNMVDFPVSAGGADAPGPSRLAGQPLVLLSAHIDTVFPAHTPLDPILDGHRLAAPGACDNGAGVVALLALAAALMRAGFEADYDILFAGNVGEEGEGNLRGMRHIYASQRWQGRIASHLVLDGAGHEIAVTAALGSRRFEVVILGSGGHSWTDAGRPNPITAMSEAIATMNQLDLRRATAEVDRDQVQSRLPGPVPVPAPDPAPHQIRDQILDEAAGSPASPVTTPGTWAAGSGTGLSLAAASGPPQGASASTPRSAWNVGTIEGGASVNSIPEQARARFDLRSTDPTQLLGLEVALHRAVEDAVLSANAAASAQGVRGHALSFAIEGIGSRPGGALPEGARILDLLRAVDRHLNLHTECRTASTDANIPLSLGVEAISIGAGGDGGGIHTRGEWYDARGRDLGLRRVLLLLLALASRPEVAAAAD